MDKGGKKRSYQEKKQFSDQQIYDQIKEEIRQIKESKVTEVEKIQKVHDLYKEHKESKKRRKMMERGADKKYSYENKKGDIESESDEPGQINESQPKRRQRESNQQQLTKQQLGELIKQVTLTRKRLIEFLDNRKFDDLVKGCFVRYKCDSASKQESYMIAQIIGVKQGVRQYVLTSKHKTKILLVIQQSNIKIVELPIQMISNQAISGTIQITKWIEQNGDKIPKQRQIKEKLQQHNRLLTEQLSSQQIDKNILNRAVALAKGQHQVRSLQDLQNLLDFILEKYESYQMLEEEEAAKRKQDKLELIQIRRKKLQYQEVFISLTQKRRQYLQTRRLAEKEKPKDKSQKLGVLGLKIEQRREDSIRQKWKLRQMLLCTADGYEKVKMNLLEIHTKYELQIDF